MAHPLNFVTGWWLILASFASGAVIGLRFHQEAFLGGYASLRRRLTRLGHIALAALGGLNVLYGLSPGPTSGERAALPGALLVAGAITMPLVCFLAAWRASLRRMFIVPVLLLMAAVILIIWWAPS